MRYSKDHKVTRKKALVRAGGKFIKELGFAGASVDQIMGSEGLTGAAMYSHFESKAVMLQQLLAAELERSLALFDRATTRSNWAEDTIGGAGRRWAASVMGEYLSLAHARDAGSGCAFPSLTQELPRQDESLRKIYADAAEKIVSKIAVRTGRPEVAAAIFAMAVGGVSIARALPDDSQASAVLESAKRAIAALLVE